MRTAVLGGTGKTGRAVCAALGPGADPLGRGAWGDLVGALGGCDAVYVIAPNMHPDEEAYVASAVAAARAAGVGRLVYHSVASPNVPAMPHHLAKGAAEDVVRRSGLAWTILRPGPYLQNFPMDLDASVVARPARERARQGLSGFRIAYSADALFGFADLADVAQVAAVVLSNPVHVGATYDLATRTSTVAQLAGEAGVEVEVITPQEWAATDGARLEPRVREWLLAMFRHYDERGLPVDTSTLRELLGRSG